VESHTPKNHAEYAGHNSPPCCSSSQGDQRAVSPARWRTGRLFRSRPPAPRSPQRVFWSSPGRRQRRLQLRIRAKPQAPSAFAFRRRSVRRRRPDPPKHHVTPRGVRRYRDSASRQQFGNPATRGHLGPYPGGGREADQVWHAFRRFRRPGRHSWPGWFSRYFSSSLAASAPQIPGTMSKPNGAPRKYQNRPSSWSRCPLPGGMGIP
jgi:hypothetical protein